MSLGCRTASRNTSPASSSLSHASPRQFRTIASGMRNFQTASAHKLTETASVNFCGFRFSVLDIASASDA
eukprot:409592-Rhodomonas_salina.2